VMGQDRGLVVKSHENSGLETRPAHVTAMAVRVAFSSPTRTFRRLRGLGVEEACAAVAVKPGEVFGAGPRAQGGKFSGRRDVR
jgi:hypothetical protein